MPVSHLRTVLAAILVGVAIPALPRPATADTVAVGQEGELARLLAPRPGAGICYARAYDADHLRAHPRQTVTDIRFALAYHRHPVDAQTAQDFRVHGQRNYYFRLWVKQRGRPRPLVSVGECSPRGDGIVCTLDCDGGGVRVRRESAPGTILISLGEGGRIRMSQGCGEDDTVDLVPGADDRAFRLTQTEAAACPPYEKW